MDCKPIVELDNFLLENSLNLDKEIQDSIESNKIHKEIELTELNRSFFCYLLILNPMKNKSYIGATIDVDRRLRQHNKIIKGGAVATTSAVTETNTWKRVCYVSGFPNWSAALQFEWRWKQLSRKCRCNKDSPLLNRMKSLKNILSLEKSTSTAIPFKDWKQSPIIHWEDKESENIYNIINI